MPYQIVQKHSQCHPNNPWAVIKSDDRTVMGCHPTREQADRQLAALHASEPDQRQR
jgi:hypothetical protein